MNFAFTSIIIFILLAPGYIYIVAYRTSKLCIRKPASDFIKEISIAIIPSFLAHIFGIFLIEWCTTYRVDFRLLGNLLLGVGQQKDGPSGSFDLLYDYKYHIGTYIVLLSFSCYGLGHFTRFIVRRARLDLNYRIFRFSNKWHYIFSGECLGFPDVPDQYNEISFVSVDVLCTVGGHQYIYIGRLLDYHIGIDGELTAVHLKYPKRRKLGDDAVEHLHTFKANSKYYQIPSRFIIIPMGNIVNLNINYIGLIEEDPSNQELSEPIDLI